MATRSPYPASRVRIRQIDGRRRFHHCAAHNSELERPEFVLGLAAALGLILESGLALPDVTVGYGLRIVGFALVVGGLTIVYAGYRELANAGQNSSPGYATTRLVTNGIFRYSRNPLSFGYIIALTGAGLFLKSTGLFVAVVLFAVLATWVLMKPEEAYLEEVFGEDYRCYARAVRRWV